MKVTYRSNGPGVIIVNIILCNDVYFTHVTIINNLLTYTYSLNHKLVYKYVKTIIMNVCVYRYEKIIIMTVCVYKYVKIIIMNVCVYEYVKTIIMNVCVYKYVKIIIINVCVYKYVKKNNECVCV